jgi:hypothetical protein
MRARLALAALTLTLALAGCGGGTHTAAPSAPGQQAFGPAARLADLTHPGRQVDLFSRFNHDQGVPRLVLLVSPT